MTHSLPFLSVRWRLFEEHIPEFQRGQTHPDGAAEKRPHTPHTHTHAHVSLWCMSLWEGPSTTPNALCEILTIKPFVL